MPMAAWAKYSEIPQLHQTDVLPQIKAETGALVAREY